MGCGATIHRRIAPCGVHPDHASDPDKTAEIALNGEVALAIKLGLAWKALICGPA